MTNNQPLVWTTERRLVSQLIPLPYNPRKLSEKQRKDLEESLTRFNLVEIPAINLDNSIIAGHQRIMILVALGRGSETIDVRVPNRLLTRSEIDEYLVRSNKNQGEWDIDLLKENFDLSELQSWGFSHDEFKELGLEIPTFDPIPAEDQPRLDLKKPVQCPECGHEFTP